MALGRFLSWRRYRRCRQLFRRPLSAHLRTALGLRSPLDLELRNGGVLHLASGYRCRRMFDWVLQKAPSPFPVHFKDGLVEFNHSGRRVTIPVTSGHTFRTVVIRDGYGLRRLPESLGSVVDLGSNVGLFAMQAVSLAQRVICVESMQANLEICRWNLAHTGDHGTYTVRRAAMSGRSGVLARIYSSRENPGGHSMYRKQAQRWGNTGDYEEVTTLSLADLFASERIDRCSLLKCDIEGAEFETFEAAPVALLSSIDRLLMEVHFYAIGYDFSRFRALCRKLQAAGFRVRHTPLRSPWGRRHSHGMLRAVRSGSLENIRRAA